MEMSTHRKCRLEIRFDRLLRSLSILLIAAIGAELIDPYDGLQIDKQARDYPIDNKFENIRTKVAGI